MKIMINLASNGSSCLFGVMRWLKGQLEMIINDELFALILKPLSFRAQLREKLTSGAADCLRGQLIKWLALVFR